jgi:hypothetical protein
MKDKGEPAIIKRDLDRLTELSDGKDPITVAALRVRGNPVHNDREENALR